MPTWDDMSHQMESAVDDFFGIDVVFLPFKEGGYSSGHVADDTRTQKDGRAVVVSKRSVMKAAASSFISRRLEADMLIEVRTQYLSGVQNNDRVRFVKSGVTYEISYIEPPTNGRGFLHLMEIRNAT